MTKKPIAMRVRVNIEFCTDFNMHIGTAWGVFLVTGKNLEEIYEDMENKCFASLYICSFSINNPDVEKHLRSW